MYQVTLRPFDYGKDLQPLYRYMTDMEHQKLFSHKFQIHNLPMFQEWLNEKFHRLYHDFFMIENGKGETVGFTYSYEFMANDRHCKFALCLWDEYKKTGYGAAAACKMMDHLFGNYSLNQVFTTVFDYNPLSLSTNLSAGFEEVGCLPNYRYLKGKYYSLHYLSMERQRFYERFSKLLSRLDRASVTAKTA